MDTSNHFWLCSIPLDLIFQLFVAAFKGERRKDVVSVFSVAAKVAEYLVVPRGHPSCSFCNNNSNFENLKREVEKLMGGGEKMHHLVDHTRRNGEEIVWDVKKWLPCVHMIIDEVGKFNEEEEKARKQCFLGLFPNLKTSYHLSKEAVRGVNAVAGWLEEAVFFGKVSYHTIPREIWATSMNVYDKFELRLSHLKDTRDALHHCNPNMIGVYGMGGVGKMMLVKEVGQQDEREKLLGQMVMVVVSHTPDIKKFKEKLHMIYGWSSVSRVNLEEQGGGIGISSDEDHLHLHFSRTFLGDKSLNDEREKEPWNLFTKMIGNLQ